jgi:hypothetical protein
MLLLSDRQSLGVSVAKQRGIGDLSTRGGLFEGILFITAQYDLVTSY